MPSADFYNQTSSTQAAGIHPSLCRNLIFTLDFTFCGFSIISIHKDIYMYIHTEFRADIFNFYYGQNYEFGRSEQSNRSVAPRRWQLSMGVHDLLAFY